MPENVPFMEADLASHVLRMRPHQWQDQYNLQKKGMTPINMRTLLASLEAIERLCTHEKANVPSGEKASHKNEAGASGPVLELRCKFPRKSVLVTFSGCVRTSGRISTTCKKKA